MSQTAATIEQALARLTAAVGRLEAAVERRLTGDLQHDELEKEFARLGEDRSRLAMELDQNIARAGRLEEANREVSRRLVAAMESIRTVLDSHGG